MTRTVSVLSGLAVLALLAACVGPERDVVVVYTALDRTFSEPVLRAFEQETGIRVLPKYDTEAAKTVGLVNAIRAERRRPRCDVFWNNEIVNTIRLKQEGLLEAYRPAAAQHFPAGFRDVDGYWTGFAARARVLLVNTNLVAPRDEPRSVRALADPRWKGRVGLAKPLFGTTATHAACLFAVLGREEATDLFAAMKRNDVRIQAGNKGVALNVAAGRLAFGLTDTDDAITEVEAGKPVKILYPDSAPGEPGVLFIPNTLALVKGAPHPAAAKRLIEYLLSPEVEAALARAASAQIPLNPRVTARVRVKTPAEVRAMKVDFQAAAGTFEEAADCLKELFLQ
jgi:iron(III) transport system substrate-binding protein